MRNGKARSTWTRPPPSSFRRKGLPPSRSIVSGPPASMAIEQIPSRGGGVIDEAAHVAERLRVGRSGPLVHVEFLELDCDRTALARIALMDEAGQLALALECDILAHVELAAAEIVF